MFTVYGMIMLSWCWIQVLAKKGRDRKRSEHCLCRHVAPSERHVPNHSESCCGVASSCCECAGLAAPCQHRSAGDPPWRHPQQAAAMAPKAHSVSDEWVTLTREELDRRREEEASLAAVETETPTSLLGHMRLDTIASSMTPQRHSRMIYGRPVQASMCALRWRGVT